MIAGNVRLRRLPVGHYRESPVSNAYVPLTLLCRADGRSRPRRLVVGRGGARWRPRRHPCTRCGNDKIWWSSTERRCGAGRGACASGSELGHAAVGPAARRTCGGDNRTAVAAACAGCSLRWRLIQNRPVRVSNCGQHEPKRGRAELARRRRRDAAGLHAILGSRHAHEQGRMASGLYPHTQPAGPADTRPVS